MYIYIYKVIYLRYILSYIYILPFVGLRGPFEMLISARDLIIRSPNGPTALRWPVQHVKRYVAIHSLCARVYVRVCKSRHLKLDCIYVIVNVLS